MGLRFRKSITICPGVRLNLGTTGASISAGVSGFRKSFHTSGRVTTTTNIPGTGISHVSTTRNNRPNRAPARTVTSVRRIPNLPQTSRILPVIPAATRAAVTSEVLPEAVTAPPVTQLNVETLKSVHKTCDDTVNWTEILVNPVPPDPSYSNDLWAFYHGVAEEVLNGNIDTYLQLIYEVNPLDDLLDYGGEFQFGTDKPTKMEVEFVVNETALREARGQMSTEAFHDLLQDYICSTAIRIARDLFALLPIHNTIVHGVYQNNLVLSVDYNRISLDKLKLRFADPSDVTEKFLHNMKFDQHTGFQAVDMVWTSSSGKN